MSDIPATATQGTNPELIRDSGAVTKLLNTISKEVHAELLTYHEQKWNLLVTIFNAYLVQAGLEASAEYAQQVLPAKLATSDPNSHFALTQEKDAFKPEYKTLAALAFYFKDQAKCTQTPVLKEFLKLYRFPASNHLVLKQVNKKFGLSTASTPFRPSLFSVADVTAIAPGPPSLETNKPGTAAPAEAQSTDAAATSGAADSVPSSTGNPSGGAAGGGDDQEPPPPPGPKQPANMASPNATDVQIPKDWYPQHCDPTAQPGKVPTVIADYVDYVMIPDQSEAGKALYYDKGTAFYVKSIKTDEIGYSASRLVTLWGRQALVFQALKKEQLKLEEEVDANNLSSAEKAQLELVKDQLKDLIDVHSKIQSTAQPFCDNLKGSSVITFQTFITYTTQTAGNWIQVWKRWISQRDGRFQKNDANNTLGLRADPARPANLDGTTTAVYNSSLGKQRLPEIQIKVFSGKATDYLKWLADWENYFASYSRAGTVNDYQLMSYLSQSMPTKGESGNLRSEMTNLTWDKKGYDTFMAELSKRFGDTELLELTFRKSLHDAKAPRDNLDSFHQFRRTILDNVRGLSLIGINISAQHKGESDQWLTYLLYKLTPTQKTAWYQYRQLMEISAPVQYKTEPLFNLFLTWTERFERQLREESQQIKVVGTTPSKHEKQTHHGTSLIALGQKGNPKKSTSMRPGSSRPTQRSTSSPAKKTQDPPRQSGSTGAGPCCFCRGPHRPLDCPKPPTKGDLKMVLAAVPDTCVSCLKQGHSKPKCRNQRPCGKKLVDGKICQRLHHPRLCGNDNVPPQEYERLMRDKGRRRGNL